MSHNNPTDNRGAVLFNGRILSDREWASLVSYVQQSDHLLPFLTVYETLYYAACLRLPSHYTEEQRHARVRSVLHELGLKHCRNNLIGDASSGGAGGARMKGISGGEKRRVSIGIQLLTDPPVLLLDGKLE